MLFGLKCFVNVLLSIEKVLINVKGLILYFVCEWVVLGNLSVRLKEV